LEKQEEMRAHRNSRNRREDNITMDLRGIGSEVVV
jgi:hypothetical protein